MKVMENREHISFFKIIYKIIPMAFAACPTYCIISNTVGILHGLSHGFNIYMIQKFFDFVNVSIGIKGAFGKVILSAIALGTTLIICQLLNGIDNFMLNNKENIIIGYINKKINEKAGKLNPVDFENTEYLDDIRKAKEGAINSANLLSILTSIFTLYLPYFIFVGVYLYKLKPILAISIVLIFIPTVINQLIKVNTFDKFVNEVAPIRREYEYYERCIADREYYKETRLLGAFGYFKNIYISFLKLLNEKIWTTEKKSIFIELSMKIITLSGYMGVLYLLVHTLINGEISVGAFGAVFSSIGFMISVMEEIISIHIGEITRDLGTVKNLIRFLDMPERGGEEISIKGIPSISIQDVIFSYPGTNKTSVSHVSLEVEAGETIAIVGENGSGKTTLVKLIMGLYLPTEGRVLIGGADTSKVSSKSLYDNISAVFQNYQRYKMTLSDNISISLLADKLQRNSHVQKNALQEAILKADLEVNKDMFPYGYKTMLSREFNGVDLSGGQWQRVAIARGFYRNHNMIILDEPTAAIDPIEETKIYRKFARMAKGKTAIIVTHRLGSAKIANRIVVMEDGQIVEIGTHKELINKNGKYAEMYEAQSKWYIEEGRN